jgi:uncharacterized UPF0160 family protein
VKHRYGQRSANEDETAPCSRDPEVWKAMDILVDVGGEYSPGAHRYDHHQRDFNEVLGHGFTTKLSSAGLIYKHFGQEIIASTPTQLSRCVHTVGPWRTYPVN